MNEKAVLMCFNIPRGVSEEQLYELFCNAGPIDCIHFGKSGKSVFIVYEYIEAVATAKEIFKSVKLYGKPIRMFSRDDIDDIHVKQEGEELLRKRRYEVEDNECYNPAMKQSRNDEYRGRPRLPPMFPDSASFPPATRSPPFGFRYEGNRGGQEDVRNSVPDLACDLRDQMKRSFMTFQVGQPFQSYDQPYAKDKHRRGICERNPYEKPVSRKDYDNRFPRYEDLPDDESKKYDKPYDRRNDRYHKRFRSPPSKNQYGNRSYQNYSFKSRRY